MNSCAYLSRSYVISALFGLFTLQPTSWTVIVSAVSTVFSPGSMSGGELFVGGKWTVSSLSLGDSAVAEHHMPQTCDLQPPSTPPPSCCAPIKAELIKPQLTASAGGGGRRKKGGRVVYNYTLAFTYHFQCIVPGWQSLCNAYASLVPPWCSSSVLIDGTLQVSEACF